MTFHNKEFLFLKVGMQPVENAKTHISKDRKYNKSAKVSCLLILSFLNHKSCYNSFRSPNWNCQKKVLSSICVNTNPCRKKFFDVHEYFIIFKKYMHYDSTAKVPQRTN